MSPRQTPKTKSTQLPHTATTHMQGYWLVLTWIVLGILALLALLVFFASLPVYYTQLETICRTSTCATGQLTSTAAQSLQTLGISVNSYALFRLINNIASFLLGFVIAGVLVWRRSNEWIALLVAFMLIMLGITGTTNTVAGSASIWHVPSQLVSLLTYPTYFLVFLVFPNGRLVPRWARWLLIPFVALSGWYTFFSTSLNANFWASLFGTILFVGLAASLPAIQIYRYWRVSTPLERQQTKWVVFGFALGFALEFGPYVLTLIVSPLNQSGSLYSQLFNPDAGGTPLDFLLPLSFGVAILRYRLWDIDIIINRTLVYSILTVSLALIYVGLVIGLQSLFHIITGQVSQSPIVIVASTLAIAALFQPLRRHIQTIIDRRFYRRKYDAAKTLEAFSAILRNEVDLNRLSEHLVAVVQETMQPSHVSLWLHPPESKEIHHIFREP